MPFQQKFNIVQNLIRKPSKRRSGLPANKIRFLVAHDTGNKNSTAAGNVSFYTGTPDKESRSAHIFVDDRNIIECIPALTAPAEKAWHVLYSVPKDNELFGVNANDAAIGVEYCYGTNIDADKAYAKYVWILARLCFEFQLDPSKDVVGHFFLDPARRDDPVNALTFSRRTYDQLLKDIVTEFNECTGVAAPTPLNITLQSGTAVTAVRLNVRKTPDTRSDIIQVLPANNSVNFTEIVNNGQAVNNNPVWYKDTSGGYCWSGGMK